MHVANDVEAAPVVPKQEVDANLGQLSQGELPSQVLGGEHRHAHRSYRSPGALVGLRLLREIRNGRPVSFRKTALQLHGVRLGKSELAEVHGLGFGVLPHQPVQGVLRCGRDDNVPGEPLQRPDAYMNDRRGPALWDVAGQILGMRPPGPHRLHAELPPYCLAGSGCVVSLALPPEEVLLLAPHRPVAHASEPCFELPIP
mmetsp:Transcript_16188/g.46044  ORF Transcript_16188/g.46044 Transcript_16188/m.46044 type:complete len:200 (+) Transcript_16188:1495-2094(+)